MVKGNLKSVILFKPFDHKFTEDPDMTGPLIVGLALAFGLMLVLELLPILILLRGEKSLLATSTGW
jgi:hypothetical protein